MLTPEKEKRAAEVFESLFDLDESARSCALTDLARDEPEIAERVRHLYSISGDLDAAPPSRSRGLPQSGDLIGSYRIEELIGEGGYGVVCRATREVGESHTPVAIKFLDTLIANEEIRARFDFERQILGELDHPGIARMIDGGTTSQGIPYVVIELIEGEPIDQYCDRRNLNVTRRLELFLQVAGAIEYAHRRQVLHRDIKPANILVAGDHVVKVLDFGIAKLLSPQPGAIELSRAGQQLFTPSYSSPEQLSGARQTVGTDVYSLGVILYQLLCGHLPFEAPAFDLVEALAARQREPVPPSQALFNDEPRNTRSRQLRQVLRGDLDAVVLTALRPQLSERYSSVDALRLDIERFLAGYPVEARPIRKLARVARWMRRNVATSVLLALSLIGWIAAVVVTTPYLSSNLRARQRIDEQLSLTRELLTRRIALLRISLESASAPDAVEALIQEQGRFLQHVNAWPAELRVPVERELYFSFAQAAESDWNLHRGEQAESSLTVAVNGFADLVRLFPGDRSLHDLYSRALRERMHFRTAMGKRSEAAADQSRLVELEGSSDGRAPE